MMREVRLRDVSVSVEGLAILRNLYQGSADDSETCIAEVRRILTEDEYAAAEP